MVYISDDNTLNPIIPVPTIPSAYGDYGGIDYEHMHSASINDNRANPVVSKISPEYLPTTFNTTDPRDIGKDSDINNRAGGLEFSKMDAGMLSQFSSKKSTNSAGFYSMMDDEVEDPDMIYSAVQPIGSNSEHRSSPYSQASRSMKILERPTRNGTTIPSVLHNRNERVGVRKIGKG
jgi:hypothetical protein